ncbi:MAG: S-layer homology domain-containing protein [Thermotogota bacterium]|nr:S-layer homology domain-containing protein [Thermotogota bacterium]
MKKSLFILIVLFLSISICMAAFSDLSSSHWAYESVMYLTELGVISGMPDGTFRGNDPMTRYQSAVAMKRLLDFSNAHTVPNTQTPEGLQSRLFELESLVKSSLNAVEQVGEDYRLIMKKLENTPVKPINSGLEYSDLERLVDEILEVKLDTKNIEGAINENSGKIENLKGENQEIFTELEINNMAREETINRLDEINSKMNTYRWVSISSAVIAVGSLIMASYCLFK